MANFVSPGVYVIEKDLSDYPVAINPSVVGMVGFANQGPINKATLITSQEGLVQVFGNPSESINGQALEGSLEILETTNSMYFIRCSDAAGAKDASSTVVIGSCPAFEVGASAFGTISSLYLDVQVNINGVNFYPTPKQFNIPAGTSIGSTSAQAYAIKSILGGSLDGAGVGSYFDDTTASQSIQPDSMVLLLPLSQSLDVISFLLGLLVAWLTLFKVYTQEKDIMRELMLMGLRVGSLHRFLGLEV